ncbi:hypothetical protein FACS1894132_10190 [Clostridia bacterium]|nr:hypothetical protein FACS1894132_10190 [Clostridia bacterium]
MMTCSYKKVIAAATALIVAGSTLLTSSFIASKNSKTLTVTAAESSWTDDWLTTNKDLIVDKNGNEVRLTGVNWFGFNCSENIFHGAWAYDTNDVDKNGHADGAVHDQLKGIVDHGFNLLRVPVSSELLVSWMNGKPLPVGSSAAALPSTLPGQEHPGCNAEFLEADGITKKNSMEIFDIIMGWCKELGLKVMVDVHSPDSNNAGHNYELWYGKAGTTSKLWQDSLVWLADKYKNDDTILAYDLKNEPHGKADDVQGGKGAKWDGSTDEYNWKYAAENCGKAIMKVNPYALIMIEGIEVYPYEGTKWTDPPGGGHTGRPDNFYGAWWGGNLRGVRDYPIEITGAWGSSQVVYSPHDYGPTVYTQGWFHMSAETANANGEFDTSVGVFDEQTLLDEYWYDSWAYIDKEGIAPLLIGEWGLKMVFENGTAADEKWATILRDYMTREHINATFWCYNPDSGDTNGLVDNDWKTWLPQKWELVKPSLWQDDEGVFIGLDHEVKLGVLGQSLNDYYGTSGEKNPTPTTTTTKETTTTTSTTQATTTTTTTTTSTTANTTTAGSVSSTSTVVDTGSGGASTDKENTQVGDIDIDGQVGKIADVVLLGKHVASKITLTGNGLINANCDTRDLAVNVADLQALIKYMLKQITSLPYKG